jgi:hypothetical protein
MLGSHLGDHKFLEKPRRNYEIQYICFSELRRLHICHLQRFAFKEDDRECGTDSFVYGAIRVV